MDQIKLGIRIVSLVVGAVVWGCVWQFVIKTIADALPDKEGRYKDLSDLDICKVVFGSLWIIMHVVSAMELVFWAWS
jgi:hypothetical protein